MHIPLVDLKAQYAAHKQEIDAAIANVIGDTAFIRGKYVTEFEEAYARKYGIKHCLGVANGTDAIYIAFKMLGVGAGDEVITGANSWIASSETITQAGARPVFVDVEKEYYDIDPEQIEKKGNESNESGAGGAFTRTTGANGCHHGNLPNAWFNSNRRLRSIAFRRIQGPESWHFRQGSDIQFLSWKEPGCLRRCRGNHHRRR